MSIKSELRVSIAIAAAVAAASSFLEWNSLLGLSLWKWQDLSNTIGGGVAVDAFVAIGAAVLVGLTMLSVKSRTGAIVSALIAGAGLVGTGLFVIRMHDRLGSFDLLGVGPMVAGASLAAALALSVVAAMAAREVEAPQSA